MLLFKEEHAPMILDGRKTQTRRLWKKARVKVGSVHPCYTRPPYAKGGAVPFAKVLIKDVRRETLEACTHGDAIAEGYPDEWAYWEAFYRINPKIAGKRANEIMVFAVEFELVKEKEQEEIV